MLIMTAISGYDTAYVLCYAVTSPAEPAEGFVLHLCRVRHKLAESDPLPSAADI